MAVYIDDTGSHGYDAQFIGVEDTAWSRDAANEIIWFSGTGSCDTGFTLPNDTAWILYEVYAPDSHTNDLTDGTIVRGHTEWTSTVGTITTTLTSWKAAYDIATSFITYKVKATHYKGSDVADVYYADEGEGFSLTGGTEDGVEDGAFTGYGAWSMSDTLLADEVSDANPMIYISLSSATTAATSTPPAGVTVNDIYDDGVHTNVDIVDEDNSSTGILLSNLSYWSAISNPVTPVGDNSGSLLDIQQENSWRAKDNDKTFSLYLPAGTWSISMGGYRGYTLATDTGACLLDGSEKTFQMRAAPNDTLATWTVVSTGATYPIVAQEDGGAGSTAGRTYLSGIIIQEV